MQEQQRIRDQALYGKSDDVARIREAGMSMPHLPLRLPTRIP